MQRGRPRKFEGIAGFDFKIAEILKYEFALFKYELIKRQYLYLNGKYSEFIKSNENITSEFEDIKKKLRKIPDMYFSEYRDRLTYIFDLYHFMIKKLYVLEKKEKEAKEVSKSLTLVDLKEAS